MRLSVATNFDDELVQRVKDYPVAELFGKLPQDFVGGGRPAYYLAPLSRRRLERHVGVVRSAGIGFNYLLNAACLDNLEFTRRGQRAIERTLCWLADCGVTSVTVSLPYLLELVKSRWPQFTVTVGVFARVTTVQQARFWERLGADTITLDPLVVNRDFKTLAAIRGSVRCNLQLIANHDCLLFCPLASYHMVGLSHASQRGHRAACVPLDYCFLACTESKLSDPVEYLRATWIRPEDLGRYEQAGYERFKILERGAPTAVIVRRVRAYAGRHYQGNLLDLIDPLAGRRTTEVRRGIVRRLVPGAGGAWWLLSRPRVWTALQRLVEIRLRQSDSDRPGVYLDNRKLDGFADGFPAAGCGARDCNLCSYCGTWAERALTIDPGYANRYRETERPIREALRTGVLWHLKSRPARVPPRVTEAPARAAADVTARRPDSHQLIERLRRLYARVAPFYDLLDLPFEYGRYRQIRPIVFEHVAHANRLLDCGAGTGRNIPYYPTHCQVVGIDLSAEMMARAGRRARAARRPITWVQADVTALPWATDSFDAVTATFLFCVLPDELQPAALRELARVVRPGGRIVLLEYVLSHRAFRRWMMRRVWAPWIRLAYGASFERRTVEHLLESGWTVEERHFVYADTILLLVARNRPA